jgi:phytanoyl-CoA hydroxylase
MRRFEQHLEYLRKRGQGRLDSARRSTIVVATPTNPAAAGQTDQVRFDEFAGEEYDLRLYESHGIAEGIRGYEAFAAAPARHVEAYREHGYLVVHDLLTAAEVQSSLAGLLDLIDGKRAGFRHVQFEGKARDRLGMAADAKLDLVRKIFSFVEYEPRLREIAFHPTILAIVRHLIDAEPGIFEDKALIKPPRIGREKPWHQDHAYWNLPLAAKVCTVWIALDPATTANGCLYVIPGSHREGPVVHFRRRDWQICDDHVQTQRVVAAPLAPGGALFFDSMLHHGTPANDSPQRRRALQFVYTPERCARITQAERLAVFGSEGKDVTC